MPQFYVTAEPQTHLFQWVEAETTELAMSAAMANPNGWKKSNLLGEQWKLSVQQWERPALFGEISPPGEIPHD